MTEPTSKQPEANFDLLLFTHDTIYGGAAVAAGASGVIVDWENRGKEQRQCGHDTEINYATEDDLHRMRAAVRGTVICRINNQPATRVLELLRAADLGANEIWLPMVRRVAEVEECLNVLPRDCRLCILAETPEALALAAEFNQLPLSRVYVGLNDLWISSGRAGLFTALIDGTVEKFRGEYSGVLGFAGVTRPSLGSPIPSRLLLAEMCRLKCGFGVARRAFRRDTPLAELPTAIDEIHAHMRELAGRTPAMIEEDRRDLETSVQRHSIGIARQAGNNLDR